MTYREAIVLGEKNLQQADIADAKTGEILYREYDNDDTGRGLAGDIDASHRGQEFWCSAAKKVHAVDEFLLYSIAKTVQTECNKAGFDC